MDKLGVLMEGYHQAGAQQVRNPVRDQALVLEHQLHLQDCMREPGDLTGRHGFLWITVPYIALVDALVEHGQVGVQADAHAGVEGDLERRAHVLRAHGGHQLLVLDLLAALRGQLLPVGHVRLRLALRAHLLHLGLNIIGALKNALNVAFSHREPLLHAGLARPGVLVRLALHEDQLRQPRAVPAQPQRDRARQLVHAAVVQLHLRVVEVDRVQQLAVAAAVHGVLQEHGQVLQHRVLHAGDVLGPHPVLGRRPHEVLRGGLGGLRHVVGPQRAVDAAHRHQRRAVVALDPALVVQPGHVEGLAGVGQVLVVLLQDLAEGHEVEVHVALEGQVALHALVHPRLDGPRLLAAPQLRPGQLPRQHAHVPVQPRHLLLDPRHLRLREVLNCLDFLFYEHEEKILSNWLGFAVKFLPFFFFKCFPI
mmetsp:Transcript_21850/g.35351  ORF Transcript_21850/g.35351 Transcript_21850/m.35351 type:complete len:422 (-) Transcript_21850:128-1393(-)